MSELHNDARTALTNGMAQCSEEHRDQFFKKYGPIDQMPVGNLPWALALMTNMLMNHDT